MVGVTARFVGLLARAHYSRKGWPEYRNKVVTGLCFAIVLRPFAASWSETVRGVPQEGNTDDRG